MAERFNFIYSETWRKYIFSIEHAYNINIQDRDCPIVISITDHQAGEKTNLKLEMTVENEEQAGNNKQGLGSVRNKERTTKDRLVR